MGVVKRTHPKSRKKYIREHYFMKHYRGELCTRADMIKRSHLKRRCPAEIATINKPTILICCDDHDFQSTIQEAIAKIGELGNVYLECAKKEAAIQFADSYLKDIMANKLTENLDRSMLDVPDDKGFERMAYSNLILHPRAEMLFPYNKETFYESKLSIPDEAEFDCYPGD